jgi:hypothetical protein
MEQIKTAWGVFFFLFSLTLIFAWSKLYIISRKVKSLDDLLDRIKSVDEKLAAEETGRRQQ